MKKLLIIAILMLATTTAAVSCTGNDNPAVTTDGETTVKVEQTVAETDPETDPATDPETDPATDPETDPVTDPETDPVTEPDTEPATEPDTEPATEPDTEPDTEPEETKPLYPEIEGTIAYLPLDKKYGNKIQSDIVTKKVGTPNWAAGYKSAAYSTASTGCISLGDQWKPGTGSFSASMWFYGTSDNGQVCLLANQCWDPEDLGFVFVWYQHQDNVRGVFNFNGKKVTYNFNVPDDYLNRWMYITIVVDRENHQVKMSFDFNDFQVYDLEPEYRNASFDSYYYNGDYNNPENWTDYRPVNIGNDGDACRSVPMGNLIDEVLVFDKAVTMDDLAVIADHYDTSAEQIKAEVAAKALTNNTIAYLPLDKKYGNKIQSDIVTKKVGTPNWAAGYKSAAYSTASTGCISLGDQWKPGTGSFSASMWFYGTSDNGQVCLLANQCWDPEDLGFVFVWYQHQDNVRGVFNFNGKKVTYNFNVPDDYLNRWMYITIVVDRENHQVKMSFDFNDFQVYDLESEYRGASFDSYNYDGDYPGDSHQHEIQFTTYRPVNIGNDGDACRGVPMGNLIDEVLVFDKAVTMDDLAVIEEYYGHDFLEPSERLVADKTDYAVGESVMVSAIGANKDWVGIAKAGADTYEQWYYVADKGSDTPFDITTLYTEGLPAGEYIIRLVLNDAGWNKVYAEINIRVS